MKPTLLLLLALTLNACGQKDNGAQTTTAAATTQPAPQTNPGSDALNQVTAAEHELIEAGCHLEARDRWDGRDEGVRVDCDRVPDRFDWLRNAEGALRNYEDSIRAALNGSLSDSDRELLNEKNIAAEVALEQIRQRMRAIQPGDGRDPGPSRDPGDDRGPGDGRPDFGRH